MASASLVDAAIPLPRGSLLLEGIGAGRIGRVFARAAFGAARPGFESTFCREFLSPLNKSIFIKLMNI
jgi:hypothetical protein